MKTVKVGLIGLGNVGSAVLKLYRKNRKIIEQKSGCKIEFKVACDKDKSKENLLPPNIKFVVDYNEVIKDPEIDIIVELIGGLDPAYKIITESMRNGKHVVTANKAVLSERWDEIFSVANKYKKTLYFEAAVAAGIPVIQSLNEGLAGNKILSITGILNGTTNYILSLMTYNKYNFDTAVKKIRHMGITEADISYDISGYDTACKLSILSSLAFFSWVKLKDMKIEGIENIELQDIYFAETFGYKVKLLGHSSVYKDKYYFEVRKYLVPQDNIFANINYEYNGILLEGDACGKITFVGKGAGGFAAASAVMSDIIYIARDITSSIGGREQFVEYVPKKLNIISSEEVDGFFYLRFITVDRPGVLAKISNVLGKHNVSIASVYQKEPLVKLRRGVPILLLTHKVKEKDLIAALNKIKNLDVVLKPPVYIKIFSG